MRLIYSGRYKTGSYEWILVHVLVQNNSFTPYEYRLRVRVPYRTTLYSSSRFSSSEQQALSMAAEQASSDFLIRDAMRDAGHAATSAAEIGKCRQFIKHGARYWQ